MIVPVLLALVMVLGATPSAWAHTELTASNPAAGARVDSAPNRLTLTFSEPIDHRRAAVRVSGAGSVWTVGDIAATGRTLTVPVTPAGGAGQCTISYTVTAADGDAVRGSVTFSLTRPISDVAAGSGFDSDEAGLGVPGGSALPRSAMPPQADDFHTGGIPAWVWALVAGLFVLAVVVSLVLWRESRSLGES
ncbi:copper resistance CopC family protein [Actinophytocola sp.]|uniref:copper resistance CopC family protein n=1 Tax=Actinophytocola sp. TaxID=1872138 RepID=UPI003D6A007B